MIIDPESVAYCLEQSAISLSGVIVDLMKQNPIPYDNVMVLKVVQSQLDTLQEIFDGALPLQIQATKEE